MQLLCCRRRLPAPLARSPWVPACRAGPDPQHRSPESLALGLSAARPSPRGAARPRSSPLKPPAGASFPLGFSVPAPRWSVPSPPRAPTPRGWSSWHCAPPTFLPAGVPPSFPEAVLGGPGSVLHVTSRGAEEGRRQQEHEQQQQQQEQEQEQDPAEQDPAGPEEEEEGGEAFSFKYSPGKLRGSQYKRMMTQEELEEEQRIELTSDLTSL
ncbi:matrix-remodeling-associated protein 7 isoform X2 [Phyllostomus hastatus]|uniref:matrix-remodeling-associated protein 7 isoform X2 n=1 Tax=Phyllostomus hastatus TaxID=9423 RepID=UPI001E685412|nr:matrix-remodeling-associated protein 7 isoform X2 [Phyllostomus hastatus]XP_045691755.1 matrix-remodeling-associated protein 7 isoform X2 [Phyllostomus hastatus]